MTNETTSTKVTLSESTRTILTEFARVSQSIIIQEGKHLRVADDANVVFAKATLEETIPMDFPMADINKLLRVLKLSALKEKCELEFHPADDKEPKRILIRGDGVSIKFVASSDLLVEIPDETVEQSLWVSQDSDGKVFDVTVTQQAFKDFKDACGALGLSTCTFKNENGSAYIVGSNPTLDDSDDYILQMGTTDLPDIEVPVLMENLKYLGNITSQYNIRASADPMMHVHVASEGGELNYFIAAEQI